VISRNTAFTYRNKSIDTKQIGDELGVHYVLEGSVRRSGNRVRINAQLVDAETDAHLWAERFDGDTGDLFAFQDEITSRIANALGVELIAAEAARPTERPDALDYILRGRATLLKPRTRNNYAEAINLFEQALVLDPQSVEAQSRLADVLMSRVMNGLTDSAAADLARASELVDQALAASPGYAYAHLAKGQVLRGQNRWEEAASEYGAALALNRNLVAALHRLALSKLYAGSIEEVIPLEEQAIRLSPRDPHISSRYHGLGLCTCYNRALTRRSSGSKKGAAPCLPYHSFGAGLPRPMRSKARPNAPPPNSPKPGGWLAKVLFRASPI